jgi:hypothetical protein
VKSNNALIDRIAQRINKTFSSFSSVSRLRDPHGEINFIMRVDKFSISLVLSLAFLMSLFCKRARIMISELLNADSDPVFFSQENAFRGNIKETF